MKEEVQALPIIIFGTGGASKEAYYCIKQINQSHLTLVFDVLGFVECNDDQVGQTVFDHQKIVTSDKDIHNFIKKYEKIAIAIPVGNPKVKSNIFEKVKNFSNVIFPNIIHPSVIYDKDTSHIGQGNIILAGSILACDLNMESFNLINRSCTTGHDCCIGNFNTINPMATISGNVNIGNGCLIGAGSTILQELQIADNVTIGAGAVLTKNAETGQILVGVPAKPIKGESVMQDKNCSKPRIEKTYIIAEAGVNHNGSLSLAKQLAEVAKKAGADAVKYQTFIAENCISVFAPKADYQLENTTKSESQLEMVKQFELSFSQFKELKDYCALIGIQFISTPFDMESIKFLNDLGMPFWKIPSGEITNVPYLMEIAKTRKSIILSTGMSQLNEIDLAINILKKNGAGEITLLHCNTEYPTPFEDANLSAINALKKAFSCNVGYSDHTIGIEAPIAAVAMGANIIEKHFTLDKNMEGPDHKASLEPNELREMIRSIRNIEMAIGDGAKKPSQSEKKNINIARKSIVARVAISKGETFTEKNLTTKRPGQGISPIKWFDVIGLVAKRDFNEDELIEL